MNRIAFITLASIALAVPFYARSAEPGDTPGMDMPAMEKPSGDDADIPETPPPPPPKQRAADRYYDPVEMSHAVEQLRREHGGDTVSKVMVNLAEYQARDGGGYRWEGEAWYGGDINRVVVKSEGEGNARSVEAAEIQALYSRAISPTFNLQAGVRHDFKPTPSRTYATVGVEGLAPYWFEVEGAAFLSDKGDLLGRFETYYDQMITQRIALQPRVELNLAAQDVPKEGIGAGLSSIEAGLRLRYEIKREFAPYIGVSYERKTGNTARFARVAGEPDHATSFVVGIRTWF